MENELLNHPPINNMVNGHQDAPCDSLSMENDAEMLEQIKHLLMENNNLKETMKQMNQEMKERLEGLLKRQNQHLLDLKSENELLRKELQRLKEKNATCDQGMPACTTSEEASENKQLKNQLIRVQAEKADLLGLISELQLKLSNFSEDSFVEIRISEKESGEIVNEEKANKTGSDHNMLYRTNAVKEEGSVTEPEEVAIGRLLHSLREETQKVERLEKELFCANKRLAELEKQTSEFCDKDVQTEQKSEQSQSEISSEVDILEEKVKSLDKELQESYEKLNEVKQLKNKLQEKLAEVEKQTSEFCDKDVQTEQNPEQSQSEVIISSEVKILKKKVQSLNKELQESYEKLYEAKQLKNNLQEKCILLDKRLQENQVDLEEKLNLRYCIKKCELQVESQESEIKKLLLQVESQELEIKLERKKLKTEKNQLAILQVSYDKLNSEHQELRRSESEKVSKVEFNELLEKLDACEKALAKKQYAIDEMRETDTKHKEDKETIELLHAQLEVYCADFHAERSAKESIYQEKEELAARFAYMMQENEEMTDRHPIEELQRRHSSTRLEDANESPYTAPRGANDTEQQIITVPMCPKCNMTFPDMDTLQIHVMDCIT